MPQRKAERRADRPVPVNLKRIAGVPPLRLNDESPQFTEVQRYLVRFGYMGQPPDGPGPRLDAVTSEGLARFQRKNGLSVSAIFDDPTKKLMLRPRCGMPELMEDPLGNVATGPWTRRNLTFSFDILSVQLSPDVAKGAVRRAFATWQAAGLGLTFTEVAGSATPDIMVGWRPAEDPDRSMDGPQIAHADLPPNFSIVVPRGTLPLPLHFDDNDDNPRVRWAIGAVPNHYDVETVALHEIGHLIGLLHSDSQSDVMYGYPSENATLRTLQPSDLARARVLYPTTS